MGWRWRRDPVRQQIKGYGGLLSEVHRKLERRIRWPLDPEAEWWTLVALRSAAVGAAVGVGEYEQRLSKPARHPPTAIGKLLVEDPALELAVALHDRTPLRAAYRVLLWAYDSEMTAELWRPTYRTEMEMAASVVRLENRYEREVVRRGASIPGSASDHAGGLPRFRRFVLTALVGAATGLDLDPEHPWLERAGPTWLACYADGREAAASELKRLIPRSVVTTTAQG